MITGFLKNQYEDNMQTNLDIIEDELKKSWVKVNILVSTNYKDKKQTYYVEFNSSKSMTKQRLYITEQECKEVQNLIDKYKAMYAENKRLRNLNKKLIKDANTPAETQSIVITANQIDPVIQVPNDITDESIDIEDFEDNDIDDDNDQEPIHTLKDIDLIENPEDIKIQQKQARLDRLTKMHTYFREDNDTAEDNDNNNEENY